MTASMATAVGCLAAAALVLAWPYRTRRGRLRRLGLSGNRARVARQDLLIRVPSALLRGRGRLPAAGAGCAVIGVLLGGPVAGVVAGVYATVVVWAIGGRHRRLAASRERVRALDALAAVAADLRAGLPPDPAALSTLDDSRVGSLARAAVALAAATGAPLADLLDRIQTDARAADRAQAAAAAQRAGIHATALLLAFLPAAGIGLGHAIGADPLGVLLHTPLGAGCAFGAVSLQLGGLAWSARLAQAGRPA